MRIRINPIVVSKDNPFVHDLLDRRAYLENLCHVVQNAPTPFVLGLDSEWGTGKTKLLEMWAPLLEAVDIPVVHFNAWQADYAEEPLAPLLASIRTRFPHERKNLLEKSARVLGEIAKSAAPALLKAATAGLLDIKSPDIEGALGEAVEKAAEEQIESFERKTAVATELKQLLARLAGSCKGKRIVLFIDELDRCRPTFALALLERIKHVVDADGLFFVLALDHAQLAQAVRSVYGAAFEGERYLSRFFDQRIRLPKPRVAEFAEAVLIRRFGITEIAGERGTQGEREILAKVFGRSCELLSLSLREIEQCAGKLALSVFCAPTKTYLFPEARALLSILSQARPAEYERLLSQHSYADVLFKELRLGARARADEEEPYEDSLVGGVLLSLASELHNRRSALRAELDSEFQNSKNRQLRGHEPISPRLTFLGNLLEGPRVDARKGFGVVSAVEAIAMEKNFVNLVS